MTNKYYIYFHIRLDTNTVFYVGKGKGRRAWDLNRRNVYWHNIVNKCDYKVEIIKSSLFEKEAFDLEIELISFYKLFGQAEANLTMGGEGSSGFKHSDKTKQKMKESSTHHWKDKLFSEEHLKNLSASHCNIKVSEETKKKISNTFKIKGHPFSGKTHTLEVRKRLSESHKGKVQTEATKKKLSEKLKGRIVSEETRKKLSIANTGKHLSEETKLKLSKFLKGAGSPRAKKVINVITGEIFGCTEDAAKSINISKRSLRGKLSGNRKNNTPLQYLKKEKS